MTVRSLETGIMLSYIRSKKSRDIITGNGSQWFLNVWGSWCICIDRIEICRSRRAADHETT